MIGGGLVHLGLLLIEVGSVQLPLFRRPAISSTTAAASVATTAVFALFVS